MGVWVSNVSRYKCHGESPARSFSAHARFSRFWAGYLGRNCWAEECVRLPTFNILSNRHPRGPVTLYSRQKFIRFPGVAHQPPYG